MKHHVLFVDDQPRVLDNIRRQLGSGPREWEAHFAATGQEALELLERQDFEVLISDLRMPAMSGSELLLKVKKRFPAVVRVAMSGLDDRDAVLSQARSAHQFIVKPCELEDLRAVLHRALQTRRLLSTARLRRVITQIDSLPSLPTHYNDLIREIQSPHSSATSVGALIERDMAMTGKVLQLANSAFFGRGQKVTQPTQAVRLLGLDTIRAVAVSTHAFSQFATARLQDFSLEDLWNHSLTVAVYAKWVAAAENGTRQCLEDAFIAGLLHDIGRLALAAEMPVECEEAQRQAAEEEVELCDAERASIGAGHPETGAYLLGIWGLPDLLIETVAYHHEPSQAPLRPFGPLAAVHIANALSYEFYAWQPVLKPPQVDPEYLDRLEMADRVEAWRKACQDGMRETWGYAC